ncbi:MAG: aminotransferase class III-fold pyridoxal phosphate-dependent enzyme [Phycisphaerae bacterium]|nr:aminotransferase class III-fold pyridoxal phosphate-dependent enzyme [Phycisphaerae bacterium]
MAMALSIDTASSLLKDHWNCEGKITALIGERDLNFRVDGEKVHIFKVYQDSEEKRALLHLEDRVLEHLNALRDLKDSIVPRALANESGSTLVATDGKLLRLLTWIEGPMWGEIGSHSSNDHLNLGRMIALVDKSLATLPMDGDEISLTSRSFIWNMNQAQSLLGWSEKIEDTRIRKLVENLISREAAQSLDTLATLPPQLIHNDANEWNIVLGKNSLGLIDFGDLIYAPRIVGVAVASAYLAMHSENPAINICDLLRGYHSLSPLASDEVALLYDLMRVRIATSIANAALQSSENPRNHYLNISQGLAPKALSRLPDSERNLWFYRFRNAIGLEADPLSKEIRSYLLNRVNPKDVLGIPLHSAKKVWIDWSVDAPKLPLTTEEVADFLHKNSADVGIGRYCENRAVYTSDSFDADAPSARTYHLGVDLWQSAGARVHAPLAGTIEIFNDNDAYLDYGPVVILRHETDKGHSFFTLYGHLAKESLTLWQVGKKIQAGELIGWMGDESENVGWPPHLHFQLITDLCGMGIDIYGVAPRDEVSLWRSISPNPNLILRIAEGTDAHSRITGESIKRDRGSTISQNLSLNFSKPLHIVRGEGAYLYDESGRAFLDMVNNVAHVGHCHPRVVEAGVRQMRTLNTNTRFLHQGITEYARSLIATLPDPLSVIFFVNSGSEANDLAIRLARAHTKRNSAIALRHGYHGHTECVIEISPYKFLGKGGLGKPSHCGLAELPDTLRGLYRGEGATSRYLAQLSEVIDSFAGGVGAFFAESIVSTAGQIVLPDGYLRSAFKAIRDSGGVCVSDEVQIGLGRVGEQFWGFQLHGVLPDIVTMGKPLGNGHPLAAVATTPEIAASFNNGMEYFNTFGGNPVSAAIGQAVFDVVEDEGLQRSALRVGQYLQDGVRRLAQDHPIIGDVRGHGLFIGVELIKDLDHPATAEVADLMEFALMQGVMLSCDGPANNVLKIKPPMVITEKDVDLFLEVIEQWLVKR